jgi:5-methylcytosine-specific restriction endonuclease McrA
VTKRDALLAECSLAAPAPSGACGWCAAPLPLRRRAWCSDRCGELFWANHWWSVARSSVKRRDRYRCRRCGAAGPKRPSRAKHATHRAYLAAMRAWRAAKKIARLEVNHIVPCAGQHTQLSCAHHLDNLETLCLPCHKAQTAASRCQARAVQTESETVVSARVSATRI